MDDENKEIILAGDFVQKRLCQPYSIREIKDLIVIAIYQVQQQINKPSRITNCSITLLDIIHSGVAQLG